MGKGIAVFDAKWLAGALGMPGITIRNSAMRSLDEGTVFMEVEHPLLADDPGPPPMYELTLGFQKKSLLLKPKEEKVGQA